MEYQIIYTSKTGNTRKLAEAVFDAIESPQKVIYDLEKDEMDFNSDIYFVGFWTNSGSCSIEVLDILSEMHGKKIAMFGTCGLEYNQEYYREIESHIDAFIPDDNEYLGTFLCQGKMPLKVKEKYEEMLEKDPSDKRAKYMIENFEKGLKHPDQQDIENVKKFVGKVSSKK